MMKKLFSLLLTLSLILVLAGCSSEKKPGITFVNGLDQTWDNLYISIETDEEWGDSVISAVVNPGGKVRVDMDKFTENNTAGVYDIGVICHNNMNYDVYGVTLADGYEVKFTSTGNTENDTLTVSVTDTEGKVTTYQGYIYANE